MELTNNAKRMLKAMRADPERTWDLDAILEATDWSDQAHVAGAGGGLGEAGMVVVSEQRTTIWSLGPEGEAAAESGLLEARVWDWLSAQDEGSRGMRNLQASEAASKQEAGIAVGLLKDVGVPLVNGSFSVPGNTAAIDATIEMRTEFISSLAEAGSISEADLDGGLLEHFHGRKGLLDSEERVERTWRLTARGIAIDDEDLEEILHVAEITPDLLQGEEWRTADFKPYDVDLPAPTPVGGRAHPMQALIERIRAIFLEMGFSEIEGDFVQSAGWNMDALFIPQDHPAREMQDTFYLDEPASIDLAAERVAQWADVHQSGGGTGSTGWGSEFSEETAHKGLLRTHTTVNTIRYLADRPNEPCRVFGIGRVFRKESIDRTHLPEFHQIEGIIMEPEAEAGKTPGFGFLLAVSTLVIVGLARRPRSDQVLTLVSLNPCESELMNFHSAAEVRLHTFLAASAVSAAVVSSSTVTAVAILLISTMRTTALTPTIPLPTVFLLAVVVSLSVTSGGLVSVLSLRIRWRKETHFVIG